MKKRARTLMVLFLLFGLPGWHPADAAERPLREDPRVESALELLGIWLDAQVAYGQIPGASAAVVHEPGPSLEPGFRLCRPREPEPGHAANHL